MSTPLCRFALLATSLLALPLGGHAQTSSASANALPSRLIVRFADDPTHQRADMPALAASTVASRQAQVDRLAALAGRPLRYLRPMGTGAWLVDAGSDLDQPALSALADRLRASAGSTLRYIEPDRLLQATLTPNDPYFPNQWDMVGPAQSTGIGGMNLLEAWDRTTGTGAVVAIIDTGYRPHADLAGQVVAQYDFISDAANANDGDGRDANAQDPGDFRTAGACGGASAGNSSWHGTHVAGTVAALGNNALGVSGVTPGAKLVIARVLGACGGMMSDISDAVIWASGGTVSGVPANPRPSNVINMSLGGGAPCSATPDMQAAINSARSRNTSVVVAAGNSNADAANFTPASCTGAIAVAATGDGGTRAPYSNYGSTVAIAAPGGDMSHGSSFGILSTYNNGATTPGSDNYAYLQGTSMASPHVAGLLALLYSLRPSTTADQARAALIATARAFPGTCTDCGAGIADGARLIASLGASAGTLNLSASSYAVAENGGSVTVTVQRSGGSAGAASVSYATANGTAIAGSDYTAKTGTLSWADGDSSAKTFSIPILDDTVAESTETLSVTLSSASGATLGTVRTATISITDNDTVTGTPGTVQFSPASYSVAENGGSVTVNVTRSGGSSGAATVAYSTVNGTATAGSDYTSTSGTLSWAAGETATRTIRIPIVNDSVAEATEAFSVRLSAATGASIGSTSAATVTITDDDSGASSGGAGTLAFTSTAFSVDENGGVATITVARTGGTAGTVKVNYGSSNGTATAGLDYAPVNSTLTWGPGDAATKSFSVPIFDDTDPEGSETVTLSLSAPTGGATLGAAKTAVLTIRDNDAPGSLAFSAATTSVSEGAGSVTLTVTRSGGSAGAVSVSYATAAGTATAGSDFTAKTGTLSWPTGDSAPRTIVVPILNDTVKESAETFQVRLSAPVKASLGSVATSTVTITDND